MPGFRFDCDLCDETFRAATVEPLKATGRDHLDGDHDSELAEEFGEIYGGEPCRNDCGYVFPADAEEVAGFDCPECGHDNFSEFADRYLFWKIEDA